MGDAGGAGAGAASASAWPLGLQLALYHALFVYAVFSFPSMLTAAHTLLLVPFVLLYMAVAYPASALLKRVGLIKGKGVPALGKESWKGKVVLVTGANTGIGKEAARNLARYGATVVLGVRNPERGASARADIIKSLVEEGGHGPAAAIGERVVVLKGDLQDLDDVARCARAFCDTYGRLDALVLNAGLAGFHSRRTAQGYDLILGVNFLGHYGLTRALLPLMEATARRFYAPEEKVQPRVVCVSSTLHQWSRDDPAFLLEERERWERGEKVVKPWYGYLLESVHKRDPYPDSKLAQMLLAQEINRRAKAAGPGASRVRAVAVNPGAVATDIWRFFPEGARERYITPVLRALFLTPHQGAVPVVAAAVAEPYDDRKDADVLYMTPYFVPFEGRYGGLVLFDLFSPSYGYQRAVPRLPEHAEAKGAKLWDLGERISKPHLKGQGFVVDNSWPAEGKGVGMAGVESEPVTPERVSLTEAGKAGSPSMIGEEPTEPAQ